MSQQTFTDRRTVLQTSGAGVVGGALTTGTASADAAATAGPEAEHADDDLSARAAASQLPADLKTAFDDLANFDDLLGVRLR